mgnify:CR=1 FL=1
MADRYFNFPIMLMRMAPNIRQFCDDVMDYCIYAQSMSLNGPNAMRDAGKHFNVTLGNIARSERDGRNLYNSIDLPAPMTGISHDLLFTFYKEHKTEHEIAALMAFLAIKSILGKKSYCRVTNEHLLSRMAGFASDKTMDELPEYLKQYTSRRKMNSLKMELQRNYRLKIYARYTRGFFVSFTLSLEELIREVEMKRKRYYEQNLKNSTSAAVTRVINQLYNSDGKNEIKP